MLRSARKYLKSALFNAVVRPLREQLVRVEKQQEHVLTQVNQISRRFHLPVAHSEPGLNRFFDRLVWDKLFVIDYACQMMNVESFADLGGAWCDYEGGYSFYTMEKHYVPRGILIDSHTTPKLEKEVAEHPGLRFIKADFSAAHVAEQIGTVDVIFLFDVLYVQANPGWERLLELYADRAKCILISNVHFNQLEQTIRLMDLGKDEYFNYVPATPESPGYKHLFDRLDDIHPEYQCKYRDCHHYWQWAMTDRDLIEKMRSLGFRLHYLRTMSKRDEIKNEADSRMFAFFKDSMRLPCQ